MSDYSVALVNDSSQESSKNEAPNAESVPRGIEPNAAPPQEGEAEGNSESVASNQDNSAEATATAAATGTPSSAPSVAATGEASPAQPVAEAKQEPAPPEDSEPECESAPESESEQPEKELARVRDQLLRTAADFDNFRKRSRKEVADADRQGRTELLRDLLPVFDNLERAAAHASSATEVQALADGIEMVMRQFLDALSKAGIERVEAVGKAFDPTVHEAIQQLETAEHDPGTVAAEVQAGYRLGDRLIRPSMVVVAKAPSD